MQKTVLFAVFALMAACGMAPEPNHPATNAAAQSGFQTVHDLAFHVVDDPSASIPRDAVRDVTLVRDPNTDRPAIAVDFTDAGARLVHDVTARSIGRRLAVTIDDHVVAQPVIKQAIDGARALITFDEGAASTWQLVPGHW